MLLKISLRFAGNGPNQQFVQTCGTCFKLLHRSTFTKVWFVSVNGPVGVWTIIKPTVYSSEFVTIGPITTRAIGRFIMSALAITRGDRNRGFAG